MKKMTSGYLVAVLMSGSVLLGCAHAEKQAGAEPASAVAQDHTFAKPGFYTERDKDGRLWVFEEGSEDLKSYKEKGKPARQVRRPAAGPNGETLISTEMSMIIAYVVATEGFYTEVDKDGRLWVLAEDSEDLKAFKEKGKPARQVRRPAAGPLGMTVISTELDTIDAYLAARQ